MTRIYFKTKGTSSTRGRGSTSSSTTSIANTAKSKISSSLNKSSSNSKSSPKPSVAPPVLKVEDAADSNADKLDPSAIEEIADGLEKMVLSWTSQPNKSTHLVDRSIDNGRLSYAVDDGHASLVSSNTIKSATMEMREDVEFSIGTKETTISFIHQRHPQQHLGHLQAQNQKPMVVDDMCDTVQGFMRGDVIRNSVISINPNGDCDVIDYPVGNAMGQPSAVWYLSPTLDLPNTVNLSRTHSPIQGLCGNDQEDDIDAAEIEGIQQKHHADEQWNLINQDVISDEGPQTHESSSTTSEKISCKLEIGDTNTWSEVVEINGGNKIKDLLGKKLAAVGTDSPSSQGSEKMDGDYYKKKVEELQIALLECAMEYEVKIVEMKMQALQTKSTERRNDPVEKVVEKPEVIEKPSPGGDHVKDKRDAHRVEYLKKQLSRLQNEKAATARELTDLKKRERQFDLQRRSLDDALSRVNFLQSELAKKEQDILDCRLREKEAKAQLYELQIGLQKAQSSQIEPRKLLTLLPALKDWIHCTRKGHGDKPDHIPPIDNIVCAITKEIQTLQTALTQIMSSK